MYTCILCTTLLSECDLELRRTFSHYSVAFDLFRCPACRFVQTVPMPNMNTIDVEYGDEYMAYNPGAEKTLRIASRKRFRTILKHCRGMTSPIKLLDVGCSTGWFLEYARSQKCDVYGVELSPYAAKQAIAKLGKGRVQNALLECSTFEKSAFDVVYSNQVIEHTPDPVRFLSVITEYLKCGGLLVLGTPNGDSLAMKYLGGNWASTQKPDHLVFFNPANLRGLVERQGYEVIRTYWTGTPYIPTRRAHRSFVENNVNVQNCASNRNAKKLTLKKYIVSSRFLSCLVSYVTHTLHLGDSFVIVAMKR